MSRYFSIITDSGDVLVEVNEACTNALDDNLLILKPDDGSHTSSSVPLRAFSAKMLDIIEIVGVADVKMSETMLEMLKQEKAVSELRRIERYAKSLGKKSD